MDSNVPVEYIKEGVVEDERRIYITMVLGFTNRRRAAYISFEGVMNRCEESMISIAKWWCEASRSY